MGMLTFTDEPPQVFVIPRLEDDLIDALFYQEDEIGEMRHTAFMIECGLEVDPPDGPDVPPIPWRPDQLSGATTMALSSTERLSRPLRAPPTRTVSADDIDVLGAKLPSPSRSDPLRTRAEASGNLREMRKEIQKAHSAEDMDEENERSPSTRERRTMGVDRKPKKLVKAKSGSLHGLREAARQVQGDVEQKSPIRRKLVASKSGTLHGMRKAAEAASTANSPPKSPVRKLVVTKSGTLHGMHKMQAASAPRSPPISPVRRLVVTKSGTLHGMRKAIMEKKADADSSDKSPVLPTRRFMVKGTAPNRFSASQRTASHASDSTDSYLGSLRSSGSSEASLDTDEGAPETTYAAGSVSSNLKKAEYKSPENPNQRAHTDPQSSETKSRNRVFRNGKLVSDDGPPSSPERSNPSAPKLQPAVEKFRNGARFSDLLAEARTQRVRSSLPANSLKREGSNGGS